MNYFALITGASLAALSVALGAFGAHAIADMVTAERLSTWHTGARYLMYHGLGLILVGILSLNLKRNFRWVAYLLFTGTCVFSAALFLLVLLDIAWLGAVAPIGGLLMIAGWSTLAAELTTLYFKRDLQ